MFKKTTEPLTESEMAYQAWLRKHPEIRKRAAAAGDRYAREQFAAEQGRQEERRFLDALGERDAAATQHRQESEAGKQQRIHEIRLQLRSARAAARERGEDTFLRIMRLERELEAAQFGPRAPEPEEPRVAPQPIPSPAELWAGSTQPRPVAIELALGQAEAPASATETPTRADAERFFSDALPAMSAVAQRVYGDALTTVAAVVSRRKSAAYVQRRKALLASPTTERKSFSAHTKTNGSGVVECIFAATGGAPDRQGDVIAPGAFTAVLAKGAGVPVLYGHQADDITQVLGSVENWQELPPGDPRLPHSLIAKGMGGVRASVRLTLDTPSGAAALAHLRSKALSQWSFAFTIDGGREYDRAGGYNVIKSIDEIFEVSLVAVPANAATTTVSA